MTEESVAGNRPRQPVTDAEMRAVTTQIRLLLNALEQKGGTLLDPAKVAEAIQAIRERRITVHPPKDPAVVLEEWGDWSNLDEVPISALGLREITYRELRKMGLTTVGLLLRCPLHGEYFVGLRTLSRQRRQVMKEAVEARGLRFADDFSQFPVAFIQEHRSWLGLSWNKGAALAFFEHHGIVTLGDLSQLTVARIKQKPLPQWGGVSMGREDGQMDPNDPEAIDRIVRTVNVALERYDLPPIAN